MAVPFSVSQLFFVTTSFCLLCRQLQQQQAELEVHQRDGLSSYDLSQVKFLSSFHIWASNLLKCKALAGFSQIKDALWPSLNSFLWNVMEGITFLCASQQVPVPSIPANVHEGGKSVEKPDAIFSQERDPRFAEMFAGITACKWCLIVDPVLSLVTWCGAQPCENETLFIDTKHSEQNFQFPSIYFLS